MEFYIDNLYDCSCFIKFSQSAVETSNFIAFAMGLLNWII